jgi:general secretion pathway protein B
MSILMAALKQQHHSSNMTANGSAYWRKLALLLALLLALISGALAAYLLLPVLHRADTDAEQQVTPAQPAAILAALNAAEVQAAAEAANDALVAGLADAIAPKPEPVQEPFVSPPPVKTLTAGTVAAEPQPLKAPVTEVSAELRDKFASALKASEHGSSSATPRRHEAPAPDVRELDVQLQQQIPPLRFEAHVYATSANQRWVKVNGKTLQEGQWVTADIRINEIMPQFVLLQRGGQLFSMQALSAWPD